jgi:hypothetical protein
MRAGFAINVLGVDGLVLEGEGRVAPDHEAVADARQVGGEVLGDAVGEIVLGGITGKVLERQDDNREARRPGFFRRGGDRERRSTGFPRIEAHRPGDVLQRMLAEIDEVLLRPVAHLSPGVFGQADPEWLADPLEPRSDIDSVAHQVSVGLLDDIAQLNADVKFDAAFGRQPGVALNHTALNFDRAAHRGDHAAKLDDQSVAGAESSAAFPA